MSRLKVLVLGFAVAGLTASAAEAASFNCARARAADEKAICADRSLNDKDVKMALLFDVSRHFLAMGRRGAEEDAQSEWLKGRRQCGASKQCLNGAYDHRIATLQAVIDEVATHGPF